MVIIKGQEFDFNGKNAEHIERLDAANTAYQQRQEATNARNDGTLKACSVMMRESCQNIRAFLDDVLGEGAADRLEVSAVDMAQALEVLSAACTAMTPGK